MPTNKPRINVYPNNEKEKKAVDSMAQKCGWSTSQFFMELARRYGKTLIKEMAGNKSKPLDK